MQYFRERGLYLRDNTLDSGGRLSHYSELMSLNNGVIPTFSIITFHYHHILTFLHHIFGGLDHMW